MSNFAQLLVCTWLLLGAADVAAMLEYNSERNISVVATALAEIINGLQPQQLAILAPPPNSSGIQCATPAHADANRCFDHMQRDVSDFVYRLHKLYIKSVIFNDVQLFFDFIAASLQGSIESVNLLFAAPHELSRRLREHRLAHRLSLFMFYWGARQPPLASEVRFEEPMRAVVITRPRERAFRIYYNQAVPDGVSNLRLVNWYDADNLGLQKSPLLPRAATVYANFQGRIFRVPVFHSPPWFWVNYRNDSGEGADGNNNNNDEVDNNNTSISNNSAILGTTLEDIYWSTSEMESEESYENDEESSQTPRATPDLTEVNVTGGRDHRLLQLLAQHMNFRFVYIEAPGRTQGSPRSDGDVNESFTGGISLLQNGLADLLLGDVSLSWERRKAIEFSFFTLADSGAFATHAPRRLNEAFAIIRPFKMDVWPYLILTVLFSGPIFYAIIAMPYKWQDRGRVRGQGHTRRRNQRSSVPGRQTRGGASDRRGCRGCSCPADVEQGQPVGVTGEAGATTFHMDYIREITVCKTTMESTANRQRWQLWLAEEEANEAAAVAAARDRELPPNLFDRCIWFTVQLFLKQSCQELYHGYRAKFLMIVYWIAATYVLADVYSAQLTSQFARPPHEAPLNTLQRLQRAMIEDGYKLYVEKESSSLEMLENGTEIFRQLFALMKHQQRQSEEEGGYLIDSVEAGIKLIADGLENKAVLGGRETLYFNIQQFGSKTFQLSQKLYTRYSAVAVQVGCPFLDSLNDVLIHLFEGGILEKMTTAEYETQSRIIRQEMADSQTSHSGPDQNTAATGRGSKAAPKDVVARSLKGSKPSSGGGAGGGAGSGAAGGGGASSAAGSETSDKGSEAAAAAEKKAAEMQIIQPLNLRMLQGAFIVLLVGYAAAGIILLLELLCHRMSFNAPSLRADPFRRLRLWLCVWRDWYRAVRCRTLRWWRQE